VYTQVGWTSFLDLNPPNPLKKGAKIRILVPLFKGDLGGFLGFSLLPTPNSQLPMIKSGLALHTSSPALGIAISDGAKVRCQTWDLGRETSNYLHPYLKDFLPPQTWQDLGWIAVSNGPGGFTGTRLAVVTARVLAQQLELPVFAISSLAAIAWNLNQTGTIAISMPAQRGEIFGAVYEIGRERSGLITIHPDTVLSSTEWEAKLAEIQPQQHQIVPQSANLADTVSSVWSLAQLAYNRGQRPHWSSVLPFYGQHPVVMSAKV
jgi:tRNA threonylcarbamoyl adenosine modification protein YeaZ